MIHDLIVALHSIQATNQDLVFLTAATRRLGLKLSLEHTTVAVESKRTRKTLQNAYAAAPRQAMQIVVVASDENENASLVSISPSPPDAAHVRSVPVPPVRFGVTGRRWGTRAKIWYSCYP